MSTQIQRRRGTAVEHNTFTGAVGELTVDTTNNTVRVHDGVTAGGTRLAKFSEIPTADPVYGLFRKTNPDIVAWTKQATAQPPHQAFCMLKSMACYAPLPAAQVSPMSAGWY